MTSPAAFIHTCRIGSPSAFRGFLEDYPNSTEGQLVVHRLNFLKAVAKEDIESYRFFIDKYPENPFVFEAAAAFPSLWLGEINKRVGIDTIAIVNNPPREKSSDSILTASEKDLLDFQIAALKNFLQEKSINTLYFNSTENKYLTSPVVLTVGFTDKAEYVDVRLKQAIGTMLVTGLVGGLLYVGIPPRYEKKTSKHFEINIQSGDGNAFYSGITNISKKGEQTEIIKALSIFGEKGLPSLAFAINDSNSDVRIAAAKALGKMRDSKALDILFVTLKSGNSNQRCEIAELLGEVYDSHVEPALADALNDPFENVRALAAAALGKLRDERAVGPLITALQDKEWSVRHHAARSLGKIKDRRAIVPLTTALKDDNNYVRDAAIEALDALR